MKINFKKPEGENVVLDMSYVPRQGEWMRLGEIESNMFYIKTVIHQPKDRIWKAMITLDWSK